MDGASDGITEGASDGITEGASLGKRLGMSETRRSSCAVARVRRRRNTRMLRILWGRRKKKWKNKRIAKR